MTYSVTIKVKTKNKKNIVIYKKNYLLNTATSSEINEYIEYFFFYFMPEVHTFCCSLTVLAISFILCIILIHKDKPDTLTYRRY